MNRMGIEEQLFNVGIQHMKTGEKLTLQVWAERVNLATWGLGNVIGPYAEYRWTGSGPARDENGEVIRRIRFN